MNIDFGSLPPPPTAAAIPVKPQDSESTDFAESFLQTSEDQSPESGPHDLFAKGKQDETELGSYPVGLANVAPPLEDRSPIGLESGHQTVPADDMAEVRDSGAPVEKSISAKRQEIQPMSDREPAQDTQTMLKFMDSLESELGVPREKFAAAMVKVSERQGALPASQSAEAVATELDLPPEQTERVKVMYNELVEDVGIEEQAADSGRTDSSDDENGFRVGAVAESESGSETESDSVSDSGSDSDSDSSLSASLAGLKTPARKEVKMQRLGRSIDEMNNKFFLREGVPLGEFRKAAPIEAQPLEAADPDAFQFDEVPQERMSSVYENIAESEPTPVTAVPKPEISQPSGPVASQLIVGEESLAGEDQQSSQDFDPPEGQSFGAQSAPAKPEANSSSKAFTVPNLASDSKVDATDSGQFVDRARLLVRQGGGAMKMQLSPEGLGQVDLKVAVKNGEVNVEILAETQEARQLLEKSVEDLRGGLSQQKLRIDEIKVDLADRSESGDFAGKQDEADRQMSRDMARGFLENFRRSNQSMHQGFFSSRGERTYGGLLGASPDVQPIGNEANEVQKSRGKGRKLSLVA